MNFSRLIFRSWYYFRIGYGTYVAFPLGFASTMIVIYALAVVPVRFIHDIFPHLYIFGIVGILIIGPISIYAGLYHIKRTGAYSAEASVLTESNPYVYKAIPGKEREVILPLMMLTARGLKSDGATTLTDFGGAERVRECTCQSEYVVGRLLGWL